MAKKRFRIKDRQGQLVDYDIASSSVTVGTGNEAQSLDEVLQNLSAGDSISYDSETTSLVIE